MLGINMEYPWKFYEKSVGSWVVESGRSVYTFPINVKSLDIESVSREFFHYMDDALLALRDLFTVTTMEYPPGKAIISSPMPLDVHEAKYKLLEAWKSDAVRCETWTPGVLLRGLADVTVKVEDKVVSAGLPDVLVVMLAGVQGSDRYGLAIATNCDIWLERTISGGDNAVIGRINGLKLDYALNRLEEALDGRVVSFGSEFEGIGVDTYGFGAK